MVSGNTNLYVIYLQNQNPDEKQCDSVRCRMLQHVVTSTKISFDFEHHFTSGYWQLWNSTVQ